MNRRGKRSPIWPYLCVLACLFVLSVTAPRAWERIARHRNLSRVFAEPSADRTAKTSRDARRAQPTTTPIEPETDSELIAREAVNRQLLDSLPAAEPAPAPPAAKPALPTIAAEKTIVESAPTKSAPEAPDQPADQPQLAGPEPEPTPQVEAPTEVPTPSVLTRRIEDERSIDGSAYPSPRALLDSLKAIENYPRVADWGNQVRQLVEQLSATSDRETWLSGEAVERLRQLAEHDSPSLHGDPKAEVPFSRARYALVRWLDTAQAAAAFDPVENLKTADPSNAARINSAVEGVDGLSRRGIDGGDWCNYLQLDAIRQLNEPGADPAERRALARRILDRLASPRLTQAQHKFTQSGPIAALRTELKSWAAEPTVAEHLLADVEQFEKTLLPSDARRVSNDYRGLRWSVAPGAEHAAERLNAHYRNANLRLAMTSSLLNKLVPQPTKSEEAVYDTVVNVPVYGNSTVLTKPRVVLIPDQHRIRLGLEVDGMVDSNTVSSSGPATFHNQGRSTFLVRKLFVLGPYGLAVWPAVAEADNDYNYLVSLDTQYDGTPLLGPLVRNIARNRLDESQGQARMEVEQKVAMRARTQLDSQLQPQLKRASKKIEEKQMALLDRLGLELVPLEFSTTQKQIVTRMRLGNPDQLGAHTPRPRPPADSWFNMQLHQSAINNALEQLKLNGRKFDLPQLFAWVARRTNRPVPTDLADLPENVHLTFAASDAIRVRCEGDEIELILSFAELTHGDRRWRNFQVRTFYVPEVQNREALFVRDNKRMFFDGKSLRGKMELQLRTIFGKVLARHPEFRLLDEKLVSDPRLSNLAVSQFKIEDGWIALAYSPGSITKKALQKRLK